MKKLQQVVGVFASVSLYMLLKYYGVDVTVDQIYDLLPMGAQP